MVDFLYYLGSIYTMGWVPRPFGATRGEIQTFWFSGFGQSLNPEKTPRSQLSASWGPKPTHIPPNPDPNPAFCSGHPSFPHFRPSRPLFPPPPSRSPEIWPPPSVPPPTIKGPPSRKGSHGATVWSHGVEPPIPPAGWAPLRGSAEGTRYTGWNTDCWNQLVSSGPPQILES